MIGSIVLAMLVLFFVGIPVAWGMGFTAVGYLILKGIPLQLAVQKMTGGADSFPLMAVPFFLLAGEMMNASGITDRLIDFSRAMVGHIIGGLAHVTIVTNMVMAGVSGSAVADAGATGSVLIPAMKNRNYPAAFSAAVVGAAATIGPIIPPSIPMVIFGCMGEVSIGRLFLGGAIPGVLMGIFLMIVSYFIARRRGYPRERKSSWGELGRNFVVALPAMVLPLIIIGGIVGGIFTATEAGGIAVIYALLVGVFVYRQIKLGDLPRILVSATLSTATIMFIVAAAMLLGWVLAMEQISTVLTDWIMAISHSQVSFLLIVNIVLLILGCLFDPTVILLLFVPILMPLVRQFHIDPVHFGVVMVLNLMIGTVTPPFGYVMFICSNIAKVSITRFAKELSPFLAALIVVLFMITYLPELVLFLPNIIMGMPK